MAFVLNGLATVEIHDCIAVLCHLSFVLGVRISVERFSGICL
ncbi:hypothetical protein [Coleofasciculus sp. F4-SAH-05]